MMYLPEAKTPAELYEQTLLQRPCYFYWPLRPRGWLVRCAVQPMQQLQPSGSLLPPRLELSLVVDQYIFSLRKRLLPDHFRVIRRDWQDSVSYTHLTLPTIYSV